MDSCTAAGKRLKTAVLNAMFGKPVMPPSWDDLAKRCSDLHAAATAARSESPVAEWVLSRAGLLAAPESGLPAEDANRWIQSLRRAFPKAEWRLACQKLIQERLGRIQAAVAPAAPWGGPTAADQNAPARLAAGVDEFFATHSWKDEDRWHPPGSH